MKLFRPLIGALALGLSLPAAAYTIDEVGGADALDSYLGKYTLPYTDPITGDTTHGEAGEALAFGAVLQGAGFSFDPNTFVKTDSNTGWEYVESTDYWAAKSEASQPDFFTVKLGNGKLDYDFYVFKNIDLLNFLVVDLANMAQCDTTSDPGCAIDVSKQTVEVISHWSQIGGGTDIPEPATLGLLGLGLIGLGLQRKRSKA